MKITLSRQFSQFMANIKQLSIYKYINKKNAGTILLSFSLFFCILFIWFKNKISISSYSHRVVCRFGSCPFHSQSKEDEDIVRYMMTKDPSVNLVGNGYTVIEAGALDGDHLSNSYFFETYLGWNAVHFEPSPSSYKKLIKNRPNAHNFRMALCKDSTQLTFVESGDDCCNGLNSTMSDKFRNTWHKKGKEQYFNVSCEPLKKILPIIGVDHVDVFFLDVEGGELLALEGMDLSRIHYFIIEMDGGDPVKEKGIHSLLKANDFRFVGKVGQNRNDLFENMIW